MATLHSLFGLQKGYAKGIQIRSVLIALLDIVIRRGLKPPHQHGPIFSHHSEGGSIIGKNRKGSVEAYPEMYDRVVTHLSSILSPASEARSANPMIVATR